MIFTCKTARRGVGGVVSVASVSARDVRRSTAVVDFSLSAGHPTGRLPPVNFPLIICYSGVALFVCFTRGRLALKLKPDLGPYRPRSRGRNNATLACVKKPRPGGRLLTRLWNASSTMKCRLIDYRVLTLISLLPCITDAAGQGVSGEVPDRLAHDSDLDELLVTGARTVDLPLLTQPIIDTPQTITTIPEEVIQLQAATDLRDVLRNDPSVSRHADEDNAQGTNVQIRGFSARNDMYLDGQLDVGSYYRDPFNLEAVEVLTGPSSVLFGRGSTGGAIEQVSKQPRLDEFADGTLSAGTDDLKRITADVNIPVQQSSAFRVAGMAQEAGIAGRDVVGTKRVGLAPSFAIGINTATQLTITEFYQRQWDKPDYGVPWIDIGSPTDVSHPAAVPPGNFYGFRSDYSHVTASVLTASLRSQLTGHSSLRNQIRYAIYDQQYRDAEPGIRPIIALGTPLAGITVTRTERGGRAHQTVLDAQL
jgi:catecholate siderophore receptor